ncbi:MAG: hypothetical protein CMI62_14965 [Parvibaculum sp.]|mgnify:CR=1 FL=1|uniref:glutathione S-transferase family protein n=1 Tax=Parvibaculum sp. TaxID=2024848 RepID=UPI000C682133|nr:glutathione S-transferase family protein [Parvibaculum sp.]MAU62017.1 hypothetical protein [Parvibaculum sp.]|tara:strand:- start:6593 stop:7252 length:660 start_codon:yes stop_codon:yes gene_type:complete
MGITTGMKMYNAQLSPYAARCRMAIYAKELDVEFLDMPNPDLEEEFNRLAPMHKVPLLVDGGIVVPESETICEYLEDRGLGVPLRPKDPAAAARMRLFGRIGDLYLMDAMGELFGQINPAGRDAKLVAQEMAELQKAMGWLEAYLAGGKYAVGESLTLADCALVPVIFFFEEIGPMFGSVNPLQAYPKTEAYFSAIAEEPSAARVLEELGTALRRMMAG